MRILLLSKYDSAGSSSRVRFYQYLPYLREAGIDVHRAPLLDDRYVESVNRGDKVPLLRIAGHYWNRLRELARAKQYSLIWLEKEIFPYLPSFVEGLVHRLGIPYVVDYDDATHIQYAENKNALVKMLLGNKIGRVIKQAELVIVGNDHLRKAAAGLGARRTEVLPSVVDLERYRIQAAGEAERPSIGWIGSPHTAKYLRGIEEILNDLVENGKARVMIIGANSDQLRGLRAARYAWTSDREVALINGIDIGIMPLSDGSWERGKCGYKLIQYMACGKPVVASPVGVNREIVRSGRNGFLATAPTEWARALERLCENPGMRRAMGKEGRKDVEDRYSVQVTAPKLIGMLRSIGGSR